MGHSQMPALVGGPSIYKTDELIETGRRAHDSLCRDLGDGQAFNRTLVGDLADELARAMAQIADMEAEMDRDHQREAAMQMPRAWMDVMGERVRQIAVEGWTTEHDDCHGNGELAQAAACYAISGTPADESLFIHGRWRDHRDLFWPRGFGSGWWKPTNRRRDLVKAGALILAEIERLDRSAISSEGQADAD